MKNIFSIIYLLVSSIQLLVCAQKQSFKVAVGDSNWFTQTSGTTRTLDDVFFVNDTVGWTVGDNGTILKTTSGGDNWYEQDAGTHIWRLTDVFFTDEDNGWIIRENSEILKTNNGGISWFELNPGIGSELYDLFFIDPNTGWMVGEERHTIKPDEAIILKTVNGGTTWTKQFSDTSDVLTLFSVFFLNNLTGWVAGDVDDPWGSTGAVFKTTDGGNSWIKQTDSLESLVYDIQFLDDSTGWVVGSAIGFVAKSTNGGITWNTQRIGDLEWIKSVHFSNNLTGWITGSKQNDYEGVILKTGDGGITWNYQVNGEVTPLTSITFTNDYYGWAVGTEGTILHTTNGGVTFVEKNLGAQPDSYQLFQNYPNPFNPSTKIKFTIPTSPLNPSPYQGEGKSERFVTLKVFDVLGNEVATLVNEELTAGEYEVEFGRNLINQVLTSGVYFYQLKAGEYTQTRKMLLMK